ncbi:MAG: hypothetical protein KAY32_07955 [Candidatus Eisenbacteria sp.]|nr:hypothetical protein [Candidatus Eisenbacteria bacterium]
MSPSESEMSPTESETQSHLEYGVRQMRAGVAVLPGASVRITVRQPPSVILKVPYSASDPLDNELEVTLYTTDGRYNQTLIAAEQEQEGGRAILRFTDCLPGARYGAHLAWVDQATGEKREACALFDDVPWSLMAASGEQAESSGEGAE